MPEAGSIPLVDTVLGRLPALKKEKSPGLAALLGFLFGGIGLALYFWSFIDFIVPMVLIIALGVAFQQITSWGWLAGALCAAGWGYLRAVNSNAKLAAASVSPPSTAWPPASPPPPSYIPGPGPRPPVDR